MKLGKFSMGIGDRFGQQGKAQLKALVQAKEAGIDITPVWNKSYREHQIVGTIPDTVRKEADEAVAALNWREPYFVDADHIGLKTVDAFIRSSDYYTLDVADFIGQPASKDDIDNFAKKYSSYVGKLEISGIAPPLEVSREFLSEVAKRYLSAIRAAERIYRHVEAAKGEGRFITEVSMDESNHPQTALELFFILAAIADAPIPAQTIAPRFMGRFNKGVDYVGNIRQFEIEFAQTLAVISFATEQFNLPANLKLSIHTGSDKFSIYGPMGAALRRTDAGIHLKTAGTTWLEELIGLALAGGEGLAVAKEIYLQALERVDELCAPYTAVIDIDRSMLPSASTVESWDGRTFAATLRHDLNCEAYNPHFRQLLHIAFKIAAEMGERFLTAVTGNDKIVSQQVCNNLFDRHIKRLFMP